MKVRFSSHSEARTYSKKIESELANHISNLNDSIQQIERENETVDEIESALHSSREHIDSILSDIYTRHPNLQTLEIPDHFKRKAAKVFKRKNPKRKKKPKKPSKPEKRPRRPHTSLGTLRSTSRKPSIVPNLRIGSVEGKNLLQTARDQSKSSRLGFSNRPKSASLVRPKTARFRRQGVDTSLRQLTKSYRRLMTSRNDKTVYERVRSIMVYRDMPNFCITHADNASESFSIFYFFFLFDGFLTWLPLFESVHRRPSLIAVRANPVELGRIRKKRYRKVKSWFSSFMRDIPFFRPVFHEDGANPENMMELFHSSWFDSRAIDLFSVIGGTTALPRDAFLLLLLRMWNLLIPKPSYAENARFTRDDELLKTFHSDWEMFASNPLYMSVDEFKRFLFVCCAVLVRDMDEKNISEFISHIIFAFSDLSIHANVAGYNIDEKVVRRLNRYISSLKAEKTVKKKRADFMSTIKQRVEKESKKKQKTRLDRDVPKVLKLKPITYKVHTLPIIKDLKPNKTIEETYLELYERHVGKLDSPNQSPEASPVIPSVKIDSLSVAKSMLAESGKIPTEFTLEKRKNEDLFTGNVVNATNIASLFSDEPPSAAPLSPRTPPLDDAPPAHTPRRVRQQLVTKKALIGTIPIFSEETPEPKVYSPLTRLPADSAFKAFVSGFSNNKNPW
ncbi:hypothetical protein PCE1_001588 [Barthelona sp. PCE]